MANKKKRNKKYKGSEAVQTPAPIKVSAPSRSKFGNWFHDHKQMVFIRLFQIGLGLIVIWITYMIFG